MKRAKVIRKSRFTTIHVIEKNLIHHFIEWLATALSILGVLLVNFQIFSGLYIWITANVLWMSFAWKHKHYGLLVLSCSYFVINCLGIIHWKTGWTPFIR